MSTSAPLTASGARLHQLYLVDVDFGAFGELLHGDAQVSQTNRNAAT